MTTSDRSGGETLDDPAAQRDPIFETGPRLALCALLQGANWVEFATARDLIGISDSAVSKHSRTLEEAGYLEIRKGSVGRRPRTWLRLTPSGRTALNGHLSWLTSLRHAVDQTHSG
ncbi:winged helix-turn-helix domain-containing protein [Amycolatopsis lurida]